MMQPYVLEPNLTLTIGLYTKPKHYADQDSPIGESIGAPQVQGFREAQVGNAQAWYYHTDKTIVLWECFFDSRFHKHPFAADTNMHQLWQSLPSSKLLDTPLLRKPPLVKKSVNHSHDLASKREAKSFSSFIS
jgi:hypothetical protein